MSSKNLSNQNHMEIVNWNVAAINNNPFEYWITYKDPEYNRMMDSVQDFIVSPGNLDVPVSDIFTDAMCADLLSRMKQAGFSGVDETEAMWKSQYRERKVVSEFIKDRELGNKRLISMPDRITNTIDVDGGKKVFRPTPINCYPEKFQSFEDWWTQWKKFMFDDSIALEIKGSVQHKRVIEMLTPISQAKYPAITEEEEKISIPLQVLCQAIFDAIFVHLLNQVSPTWQDIRESLTLALNSNKNARTLEILASQYGKSDIVFLQEVAHAFVSSLKSNAVLSSTHHVVVPETSGRRDQLSVILLRKDRFDIDSIREVTSLVNENFAGKRVPVAEGDLVAISVGSRCCARRLLLASFHGDTNGLATIPVLDAVMDVYKSKLEGDHSLVFGMDANTYEKGVTGKTQDVLEFAQHYTNLGLASTWGMPIDPKNYTTYSARTFLQTQLNKASKRDEFLKLGDVNPKDFVLYDPEHFETVVKSAKDNTGRREYIDGMVFPTLDFPSDHAIICGSIQPRSNI